jgi:hypothetical protein
VKFASQSLVPTCSPLCCPERSSSSLFTSLASCGGPLFSQPYELLFPPARRSLGEQALCSDNHLNRPGVCCWGLSALLSRHSSLATRHFPCIFSSLQPLWRSWLSFSSVRPLFSATSSLFLQNTGGGGVSPAFSANLRDPCASLPRASKGALSLYSDTWTSSIDQSTTTQPLPFDFQLSTVDFPCHNAKIHSNSL